MTTIRVARRPKFTQIDRRTVNDESLSFRARGVLMFLLDKPDDWTTTAERISSKGLEGRDAIRAALGELERGHYLERSKWRDTTTGQWCSEWVVFERPRAQSPERDSSAGYPQRLTSDGLPAPENQASITDTETDTERSSDAAVASIETAHRGAPDCPQCQGRGEYYLATAGVDVTCKCVRELEVAR